MAELVGARDYLNREIPRITTVNNFGEFLFSTFLVFKQDDYFRDIVMSFQTNRQETNPELLRFMATILTSAAECVLPSPHYHGYRHKKYWPQTFLTDPRAILEMGCYLSMIAMLIAEEKNKIAEMHQLQSTQELYRLWAYSPEINRGKPIFPLTDTLVHLIKTPAPRPYLSQRDLLNFPILIPDVDKHGALGQVEYTTEIAQAMSQSKFNETIKPVVTRAVGNLVDIESVFSTKHIP